MRVEVDVQPPTLAVLADEATVGSLLVNLMRNAIEAMQGAPRRVLRLEARARGERVILTWPTPARASAPTS